MLARSLHLDPLEILGARATARNMDSISPKLNPNPGFGIAEILLSYVSTASAVRVVESKAAAAVLPTVAVTEFKFFIASHFRSTESNVL
ncbi:hypothetical protein ABIB81_007652 [Bradyrhizobium sp. I1.7.5]